MFKIISGRAFIYLLYLVFVILYVYLDSAVVALYLYIFYYFFWGPIYMMSYLLFYYYRPWWPFLFIYFMLCYTNNLEFKRQHSYFKFFGYSLKPFKRFIIPKIYAYLKIWKIYIMMYLLRIILFFPLLSNELFEE